MENTFLILNNGLTILLLQAKGGSGALFRKKKSFNFFFLFIREKHNVLYKSSQSLTTSQVIILCVKMFNGDNITYITDLETYLHMIYNL